MGNCQAAEAATVVIQHPGNKIERIYWSVSAHEVMTSNPGHYVALVVTSPTAKSENGTPLKQLKLLRPDDTLLIGQVYRLVSFEGNSPKHSYQLMRWIATSILSTSCFLFLWCRRVERIRCEKVGETGEAVEGERRARIGEDKEEALKWFKFESESETRQLRYCWGMPSQFQLFFPFFSA